jgi:PhnB protein
VPTARKPVPEGHHSVTPYLIVRDAGRALEFYRVAFDAKEEMRFEVPGGRIGHAELTIGDSRIMLAEEHPDAGARSPEAFGGSPVSLHLYVPDVDATVTQALAAGATLVRPVQDQFYGDRMGSLRDPFGQTWHVATRKEDVAPDEMQRRAQAAMQEPGAS